jgi:hypothetical protein
VGIGNTCGSASGKISKRRRARGGKKTVDVALFALKLSQLSLPSVWCVNMVEAGPSSSQISRFVPRQILGTMPAPSRRHHPIPLNPPPGLTSGLRTLDGSLVSTSSWNYDAFSCHSKLLIVGRRTVGFTWPIFIRLAANASNSIKSKLWPGENSGDLQSWGLVNAEGRIDSSAWKNGKVIQHS